MGSSRAKRDRQKANKERKRGNAFLISGPITANRCILPVHVGPPSALQGKQVQANAVHQVGALIDTGATLSCVSTALATKLGLQPRGFVKIGVVGGTRQAPMAPILVVFPSSTGGVIWKILGVAIIDSGADMIFGMGELMPGILMVDGTTNQWTWKVPNKTLKGAV